MDTATAPRRTALHAHHKQLGAKLVDFHGWELPIQYSSIIKEHHAVRRGCGLFDVSHMGQVGIEGPDSLAFLQKVNTNDVSRLKPGRALYSHLANEKGGVVDDVLVYRLAELHFLMVINAGTTDKDLAWLSRQSAGLSVELEDLSDLYGMVAVQGPKAVEVASLEIPGVGELPRFGFVQRELFDQRSLVSRTGYTGEDGFEVIIPNEVASRLWDNLLTKGRSLGALPCGLGARDTLRLEAGLPLYGQDLDEDHSPLEAGMDWVVKLDKGDFIGREALRRQREKGLARRLTAVRLLERGVPRAGCRVLSAGAELGRLASATFSPTLETGIGTGYLSRVDLKPGDRVEVEVYGRPIPAGVVKLPFYKRSN